MENKLLSISEAAQFLGVSIDMLRRWEKNGAITAFRPLPTSKRLFKIEDLESFLEKKPMTDENDLVQQAQSWVRSASPLPLPSELYCQTSDVFQARLQHLEKEMSKFSEVSESLPVVVAIAGEIGNNSYNHNLGKWPDMPGSFFGYRLDRKLIVLADRGQGLLKTLGRVKPDLKSDTEAIRVAFTEYISGRAPENRGNGLKFVRDIIFEYPFHLEFFTGESKLDLVKNISELKIQPSGFSFRGCLAILHF